jgi:hypothetical protein
VVYLNINVINRITPDILISKIVHEYTHLIQFNYDPYEDRWLNEGLALWSEYITGAVTKEELRIYLKEYLEAPAGTISLTYFTESIASYGASLSFIDYLNSSYGYEKIEVLIKSDWISYIGLHEIYGKELNELIQEWGKMLYRKANALNFSLNDSDHLIPDKLPSGLKTITANSPIIYYLPSHTQGLLDINLYTTADIEGDLMILGLTNTNKWVTKTYNTIQRQSIVTIPRLGDFQELIVLILFSLNDGSGLYSTLQSNIPIQSYYIEYDWISEFDWRFNIPKNIESRILLEKIQTPKELNSRLIDTAIIEIMIKNEGQWIKIDTVDYTVEGFEIQFSEKGEYYLVIILPDNSTGISNIFMVYLDRKQGDLTNRSLILIILVLVSLVKIKKNRLDF